MHCLGGALVNFKASGRPCYACEVECNEDMKVIHACGQLPRQWCPHLGFHLRIALGRAS